MTRRRKRSKKTSWFAPLAHLVSRNPIVIFRFSDDDWAALANSRRGWTEFTVARSHTLFDGVQAPTVCLLTGNEEFARDELYIGLLQRRQATSTLDTRVKIVRAAPITPSSKRGLLRLLGDAALATNLRTRLRSKAPVIRLSSALSAELIAKLAQIEGNGEAMNGVAALITAPKRYSGNDGLQEDAVALALKAFDLSPRATAARLETMDTTALERVTIREDIVIERDAGSVPGFVLDGRDLTGRAIFRNGHEMLEVITANRGDLEEVLGVDLIYLNAIKQNVVMLQYKMLDPDRKKTLTDWLYYPDMKLKQQITRMKRFSKARAPGPLEYRINSQVYYLRFVRRDAELGKSAITIPIDHFDVLNNDPKCRGAKGAFRISFNTLNGRYLHQEPFLDLIRSGYIGAHAATTADLTALIEQILKDGRAVIAAVQSALP